MSIESQPPATALPYTLFPDQDVSASPWPRIQRKLNRVTLFAALAAWALVSAIILTVDAPGGNSFWAFLTFLSAIFIWVCLAPSVTNPTGLRLAFSAVVVAPLIFLIPFALKPVLAVICLAFWVAGLGKLNSADHKTGSLPLADDQTCATPVWGKAGGYAAGGAEAFGAERAAMGAKGEEVVGAGLEWVAARYPHVRVFHGVKFRPMSATEADIDHVVVIGNYVYILDAKLWQSNKLYSWGLDDRHDRVVMRDGQFFPGGAVHMNEARGYWSEYLGRLHYPREQRASFKLLSRIVLANPATVNNVQAAHTTLISLDAVVKELCERAEAEAPVVDRLLVSACLNQMHRQR